MKLLLSVIHIPLYEWAYDPISQSTFSYSERNFRHLFQKIEYSAKKIMEYFVLVWLVLFLQYSFGVFISGVFSTCISVFDSNALHFLLLIEVISIGLLCSVLVCLGYGLFIGIGEFILCGKMSNIEQFLVFVCLLIC